MSKLGMTFEQFKSFHESKGKHFFSPNTMRFFKSRIHDYDVYSGYFVTSEAGPAIGAFRRYTLRRANFKTGEVETISQFQEFARRTEALAYLKGIKNK